MPTNNPNNPNIPNQQPKQGGQGDPQKQRDPMSDRTGGATEKQSEDKQRPDKDKGAGVPAKP